MSLVRFRFKTHSVDDYRPLVDMAPIRMPWWCTGFGENSGGDYAIIVCYLPENEQLSKYWDDAFDIEFQNVSSITYSSRFPMPKWLKEQEARDA